MWSLTSCQAVDMEWLIWLSLLLTYLPVTGKMSLLCFFSYHYVHYSIGIITLSGNSLLHFRHCGFCSTLAWWFICNFLGCKILKLLNVSIIPESMEEIGSCLSQPYKAIWRKKGEKVVLNCTVSSDCSAKDWQYEWFSFKENSHIRLPLDNPLKYRLEKASLFIESLHANDSGIYHCAAVSNGEPVQGTQYVGWGTPLVVTGKRENCL